jgi:hypothetical protein
MAGLFKQQRYAGAAAPCTAAIRFSPMLAHTPQPRLAAEASPVAGTAELGAEGARGQQLLSAFVFNAAMLSCKVKWAASRCSGQHLHRYLRRKGLWPEAARPPPASAASSQAAAAERGLRTKPITMVEAQCYILQAYEYAQVRCSRA